MDAIRRLHDKQFAADPIPTSVLKQIADVVAPFIVKLFNCSLSEGHFPAVFKEAFVTPFMKKPGLDAADTSFYIGRFRTCRYCQSSWNVSSSAS